jgi:HEAT repeat protein
MMNHEKKMNGLLEGLKGGDLRSDSRANEVADMVLRNPALLDELAEGLDASDGVVRVRTTHALERISRTQPEMLAHLKSRLIKLALDDNISMVRWHLSMIFSNLRLREKENDRIIETLFTLLEDESDFVKCWAIASLAIIGKRVEKKRNAIVKELKRLRKGQRRAVMTRVNKAIKVCENEDEKIPVGWLKAKT